MLAKRIVAWTVVTVFSTLKNVDDFPAKKKLISRFRVPNPAENSGFRSRAGLPDFSWSNIPKPEKYTKWPQNMYYKWPLDRPNCRKIDQMAIKYTSIFHRKDYNKIYPNWDFWFENTRTIWQPWSRDDSARITA
jgi:hypothetical protein